MARALARLVGAGLAAGLVISGLTVPAVASPYGLLTGTVTGPGGLPASTIDVNVMHLDQFGTWQSVGYDSTDRAGHFAIWAPPGTHRLWFKPYLDTSVYLPQYYPDSGTADQAADITVTSDSTQDFAVQLDAGPHATIAGTVRGTDGSPVAGVAVGFWTNQGTADNPWWVWRFLDETDEAGAYRELVQPGTYRVSFRKSGYVELFHDGADAVETAGDVVLADGDSASLDAVVNRVTRITGVIRAAENGLPVPGARMDFYRNVGTEDAPSWSWVATGSTDDNGAYSKRLTPGSYLARAVDTSGRYLNEFYGKSFSPDSATRLELPEEVTLGNINVSMTRSSASPMLNVALPTITGTPQVGTTLIAAPGTWSPVPERITYQWLADGVAIAGATAGYYQPVESDVGRTLSVAVQAYTPGRFPGKQSSTPTSPVAVAPPAPTPPPTAPAKVAPSLAVKHSRTGRTVRLAISLRASVPVTGKVRIYRSARWLRTVTLGSGRATVTLRRQPKGTWTYKVSYLGSHTVLPCSRTLRLRVPAAV